MEAQTLLERLSQVAGGLSAARSPAGALAALAAGARGLLPFAACGLALHAGEWQLWRVAANRPTAVSAGTVTPAAAATLQRFLDHGELLHVDDLLAPPWSASDHRDVLWKEGTRAALLVPLRAGGRAFGALSFTAAQPEQYPADKDSIAALLAWMLAAALHQLPDQEDVE